MNTIIIFFVFLYFILFLSFLLIRPKIGVYLLIFFCIFDFGFFSRWIEASRYFARLPYIFAILMFIKIFLDLCLGRWKLSRKDKIFKICFCFVGSIVMVGIVSILYNHESMILGIYELRNYFLFFVILISLFLYFPRTLSIEFFIKFCVIISLVQIPVSILQYALVQFVGIRITSSTLDMASGTFPSYPILVFVVCFTVALVLIYQLWHNRRLIKAINNYLLIIILIIPLLFSNARSAMGFVFVILLIVFIRHSFYENTAYFIKRLLTFSLLTILIGTLFYYIFWLPRKEFNIQEQLNPQYVAEYFFREAKNKSTFSAEGVEGPRGEMGRARSVVESSKLISRDFINFIFGMGPGAVSQASFINKKGSYYHYYGPFAGIDRTQISKIIAELGFLGIIVYLTFLVKIYLFISFTSYKIKLPIIKEYTFALISLIFLLSFYTKIFQNFTVLMFTSFFLLTIRNQITAASNYYTNFSITYSISMQ